ncbi:MAG: DUF362 domain-containing protein [Candidatus Lokiarchaeota archaeon]|nr:DUF362 domain-containing protein [Candidatus Lokiarchaeota archaeon]
MIKNQVAITKIKGEDVKKAVFDSLELIDAKILFDASEKVVLIKPNLLLPKKPEKAATTHPDILRAVIQWVNQFSPKRIIVGESSGTFRRGMTDRAFQVSGLAKVCEQEGVEWTAFEKTKRKTYPIQDPLVLSELTSSVLLEQADIIINLPKIKTHGQCLLTCSIKNMFGTAILGNKARTHAQFPLKERFHSALVDIYSVSQPQLTVVDGYYCQEGNGPSAGEVVKLDLVLAGFDPVGLDTVVCKIIGFNPNRVLYIQKAREKGLGTIDFKVVGESIENVKRKFKKPRSYPISAPLPKFLARYVGKIVFRSTIKFKKDKCVLCGTCWQNCPVNAIIPPKIAIIGKNKPKREKKKCITCYCCAELCPHNAIDFKIMPYKNFLFSWLSIIATIGSLGIVGLFWLILFF